ncbi:hypothetical protein BGZ94_001673, partial [Podila epigama]
MPQSRPGGSKTTDVGVLRPAKETSQNDERLPKRAQSVMASSGSDSSGGVVTMSIPLLPTLEATPAGSAGTGTYSLTRSSETQSDTSFAEMDISSPRGTPNRSINSSSGSSSNSLTRSSRSADSQSGNSQVSFYNDSQVRSGIYSPAESGFTPIPEDEVYHPISRGNSFHDDPAILDDAQDYITGDILPSQVVKSVPDNTKDDHSNDTNDDDQDNDDTHVRASAFLKTLGSSVGFTPPASSKFRGDVMSLTQRTAPEASVNTESSLISIGSDDDDIPEGPSLSSIKMSTSTSRKRALDDDNLNTSSAKERDNTSVASRPVNRIPVGVFTQVPDDVSYASLSFSDDEHVGERSVEAVPFSRLDPSRSHSSENRPLQQRSIEKESSQRQSPENRSSQQPSFEKETSQRQSPDNQSLQQQSFEKDSSRQQSPDNRSPQQRPFEKETSRQQSPESTFQQQYTPSPLSPEDILRSITPPPPPQKPSTGSDTISRVEAARSRRSPTLPRTTSDELLSSQGSRAFGGSSGLSFVEQLKAAAVAAGEVAPSSSSSAIPQKAISKRRKLSNETDEQTKHVPSSVGEDGFLEGSEEDFVPPLSRPTHTATRSRSRSQDISSFPYDISVAEAPPVETEADEEILALEEGFTQQAASSSALDSHASPSQARASRRRTNAAQAEPLSAQSSPVRRSLRRMVSATNDHRMFNIGDPVWAKWRKDYYVGLVYQKKDKYEIHFLDNTIAFCDASEMRPLRLKLGIEVLAQKTASAFFVATIEGIQMEPKVEESRVAVRYGDKSIANLALSKLLLTADMMDVLDTTLTTDFEDDGAAFLSQGLPPLPPQSPSQQLRAGPRDLSLPSLARQLSSPAGSPLKTRGETSSRRNNVLQMDRGNITPTRRGNTSLQMNIGSVTPTRRGNTLQMNVGSMTPSRRSKEGIFRDFQFVLSLSAPGANHNAERDVTAKIKAGDGEILDSFASMDPQKRANGQVFLISFTYLRTPKYLWALALNIPRLFYKWVDDCTEESAILPWSPYMLPTGMSAQFGTVISATPTHDQGIFRNLKIGLCGSNSFLVLWERILISAGAEEVKLVSASTGPMDCDFVVFANVKVYEAYSRKQQLLATLSNEWLVQCLINQR